jgi:hypothetical protein
MPKSTKAREFRRWHEFICLEQVVNAIVLADQIHVPNLEVLQDGQDFTARYLLRDPGVGMYAATFLLESGGVIGQTLRPVFEAGILHDGNGPKDLLSQLGADVLGACRRTYRVVLPP